MGRKEAGMQTFKARFDGRVFVPEQPVELPVGTVVELTLRESDATTAQPVRTAADLYGILKGKLNLSEEEIDAAKYQFDWEKWEKLHSTEEGT
jgi:hypothetical protein